MPSDPFGLYDRDVNLEWTNTTGYVARDETDRLRGENARLRELCAELLRNAQVAANVGVNIGKLTAWESRAVELGVEV